MSASEAFLSLILPSLGAISRGVLFGPMTPFLIYFAPYIWLGNFTLFLVVKYFSNEKDIAKSSVGIALGSLAKSLLIFLPAFVLNKLKFAPIILLAPMGMVQLITALVGGFVSLFVFAIETGKRSND